MEIAAGDGTVLARHCRTADGAGATTRDTGHVLALDQAATAEANTARPHRRRERIPPGPDAVAAAKMLRGGTDPRPDATINPLAAYERATAERTGRL